MKTIEGKYTSAIAHRDDIEQYTEAQIKMLCDMEIYRDAKIEIMADAHPGKIGPIGLVMTSKYDKINTALMPGLVGNDIGCGVLCVKVKLPKRQKLIDYNKLTKTIDMVLEKAESFNRSTDPYMSDIMNNLIISSRFPKYINPQDVYKSLGTLGSGNHFIELDSYGDDLYLIVHTGSRFIGNSVYEHYMKLAHENSPKDTPYELSYLSGELLKTYLFDSIYATTFGCINRSMIVRRICTHMGWDYERGFSNDDSITNIHNNAVLYHDDRIDTDNDILIVTKGANFILPGGYVCIPINSTDGCIIGQTIDSPAGMVFTPHGSGRKIKRTEVANSYTVNEYKKLMKTNNVECNTFKGTLDESPFAYRTVEDIIPYLNLNNIIVTKPLYNYKTGDKK